MEERALILAVRDTDLVPTMVMTLEQAKANYIQLKAFVASLMVRDEDYGVIPGTDKPTLLKPGAEKLLKMYGYAPTFEIVKETEDWQGGFFYYQVRAIILSKRTGNVIATGLGSCNSKENRYGDRWVMSWKVPPGMDKRNLETREFISKDNKKYTQFKIANPDMFSQVNTILKMAEKRAMVAATLHATAASDTFTQDMEDLVPEPPTSAPPQPKSNTIEAPDAPIEAEWSEAPTIPVGTPKVVPETIYNVDDDEPTRIAKGKSYLEMLEKPWAQGEFKKYEARCAELYNQAMNVSIEPPAYKDWFSRSMLRAWADALKAQIAEKAT